MINILFCYMHFYNSYILVTCFRNENPLKPRQVIPASDITKNIDRSA